MQEKAMGEGHLSLTEFNGVVYKENDSCLFGK